MSSLTIARWFGVRVDMGRTTRTAGVVFMPEAR